MPSQGREPFSFSAGANISWGRVARWEHHLSLSAHPAGPWVLCQLCPAFFHAVHLGGLQSNGKEWALLKLFTLLQMDRKKVYFSLDLFSWLNKVVSANRFRWWLSISLRRNLSGFRFIKDLDMKGMASTSGPFFAVSRAGSSREGTPQWHHMCEQQQRTRAKEDLARWTAKGETKKPEGSKEFKQVLAKSTKERAGSSCGALQGTARARGAGDRNVLEVREQHRHIQPWGHHGALNGRLSSWLENCPPTK